MSKRVRKPTPKRQQNESLQGIKKLCKNNKKLTSKGMTCPGCEEFFPSLVDKHQLIDIHMERDPHCKQYIIRCALKHCDGRFLSKTALESHHRYKPACAIAYQNQCKSVSYSQTAVFVPDNISVTIDDNDNVSISKQQIDNNNRSCIYKFSDENVTKNIKSSSPKSKEDNQYTATSSKSTNIKHPTAKPNIYTHKRNNHKPIIVDSYPDDDSLSSNTESDHISNYSTSDDDESFSIGDDEINDNINSKNIDVNIDLENNNVPSFTFQNINTTYKSEKSNNDFKDKDYCNGITLLHLLIEKKMSLHRYDDFMKWRYGDNHEYPSLSNIIERATIKTYGTSLAKKMAPEINIVKLPSNRNVPLVVFNVTAMIYDLLSDTSLTIPDNMIFVNTNDNPFDVKESEFYDDFETSTYYIETMKSKQINTQEDVLCPLVLYIDEIKLDSYGKLGLEPIVMSLLIYNRKTRNLSKSWRVIGYMPSFHSMFGNKSYSADQKANDYHFCLEKILSGIKDVQKNKNGYHWTFHFITDTYNATVEYKRKLHFPLAYIIGDTKGHDVLCGRYGSHRNTLCIGRDCDSLSVSCDDPSVRCNFLRMSKLKQMTKDELSLLSFRKLNRNAFDGIWFGSSPYGINGSVPAEPLHQINMGIISRLSSSFLSRLSLTLIEVLDRHVGYVCTHCYRQSDKSLPEMTSFTSGISDKSRLTAKEKLSRVYCIYIVLLTRDFQEEIVGRAGRVPTSDYIELDEIISYDEYNSWVNVFEETLLLTSWIYLARHPKVFFKGGRNSIAAKRLADFVNMYKISAPRYTGQGLKIVKFHQLLHLWWIIKLFGSLLNVDSSRGESNAIVVTKQPGLCTQMRTVLLNIQTASERFKRDVILKAYHELTFMHDNKTHITDDNIGLCEATFSPQGSKFEINFNYEKGCLEFQWISRKIKNHACSFPMNISSAVYNKLSYYNAGVIGQRIKYVEGYTELKKYSSTSNDNDCNNTNYNLNIIRACPTFRSTKPWFDWAMIEWASPGSEPYALEAQILMMINMTTIQFENFEVENDNLLTNIEHNIISSRHLLFIHSVKEGTKRDTSHLGRKSSLAYWADMECQYQMVDINSVKSTCFVVVDTLRDNSTCIPGNATSVISIIPKYKWSNKFLNYDNKNVIIDDRNDDLVIEQDLKAFEN